MDKTRDELERELAERQQVDTILEKADDRYAVKMVQHIVFWAVALFAAAVISTTIILLVRAALIMGVKP